jgi:diguanylate cyclase (GGDEF)-like protein
MSVCPCQRTFLMSGCSWVLTVGLGTLLYRGNMLGFVDDASDLRAAYVATRSLLRVRETLAAQRVVLTLCRALGADVAPADADVPDSVPMDISLGEGSPLLPVASEPRVRALLTRYLAPAVLDARAVVERERTSQRLQQMATIDILTGVWARQSLMFAINHTRSGDCLALIDLDHFKTINDTLGHNAGDVTLADFAAHLRGAVRDRDIVGRYGGEEFVVVFPATTIRDADAVLCRLRDSWSASAYVPVTFSAGVAIVAEYPGEPGQGGQVALKTADALMYQAKKDGRDGVRCQPTSRRAPLPQSAGGYDCTGGASGNR